MCRHKELRSWTLAGRWGDAAPPGFVWLVRRDGMVFNPLRPRVWMKPWLLAKKVLKRKAELGIVG